LSWITEDSIFQTQEGLGAGPAKSKPKPSGALLKDGADKAWGFLTLTIDANKISGIPTEIDRTGNVTQRKSFHYPAAAVVLQNPKSVPTLRSFVPFSATS